MFGFLLSESRRKEARSRAIDYADYYIRIHGAAAQDELRAKLQRHKRSSYYGVIYALAIKEVARRERAET